MRYVVIIILFVVNFVWSCKASETNFPIESIYYLDETKLIVGGRIGCHVYSGSNCLYSLFEKSVKSLVVAPNGQHAAMICGKQIFLCSQNNEEKKLCLAEIFNMEADKILIGINNDYLVWCFNDKNPTHNKGNSIIKKYGLNSKQFESQARIRGAWFDVEGILSLHPHNSNRMLACGNREMAYSMPISNVDEGHSQCQSLLASKSCTGGNQAIASVEYNATGKTIVINAEQTGYAFLSYKLSGITKNRESICICEEKQKEVCDINRTYDNDSFDTSVNRHPAVNKPSFFYHISIAFHKNDLIAVLKHDGVVELYYNQQNTEQQGLKLIATIASGKVEPNNYFSYAPRLLAFSPDATQLSVAINGTIVTYKLFLPIIHNATEKKTEKVSEIVLVDECTYTESFIKEKKQAKETAEKKLQKKKLQTTAEEQRSGNNSIAAENNYLSFFVPYINRIKNFFGLTSQDVAVAGGLFVAYVMYIYFAQKK